MLQWMTLLPPQNTKFTESARGTSDLVWAETSINCWVLLEQNDKGDIKKSAMQVLPHCCHTPTLECCHILATPMSRRQDLQPVGHNGWYWYFFYFNILFKPVRVAPNWDSSRIEMVTDCWPIMEHIDARCEEYNIIDGRNANSRGVIDISDVSCQWYTSENDPHGNGRIFHTCVVFDVHTCIAKDKDLHHYVTICQWQTAITTNRQAATCLSTSEAILFKMSFSLYGSSHQY